MKHEISKNSFQLKWQNKKRIKNTKWIDTKLHWSSQSAPASGRLARTNSEPCIELKRWLALPGLSDSFRWNARITRFAVRAFWQVIKAMQGVSCHQHVPHYAALFMGLLNFNSARRCCAPSTRCLAGRPFAAILRNVPQASQLLAMENSPAKEDEEKIVPLTIVNTNSV